MVHSKTAIPRAATNLLAQHQSDYKTLEGRIATANGCLNLLLSSPPDPMTSQYRVTITNLEADIEDWSTRLAAIRKDIINLQCGAPTTAPPTGSTANQQQSKPQESTKGRTQETSTLPYQFD